jgi:hypothetical protein
MHKNRGALWRRKSRIVLHRFRLVTVAVLSAAFTALFTYYLVNAHTVRMVHDMGLVARQLATIAQQDDCSSDQASDDCDASDDGLGGPDQPVGI